LQDQLKAEFENIANKVLTTATGQLTEKSQESLTAILDPLRTRITEFQLKVEAAHLEDTRQRSVLGEQIRQAAQANQSIGQQAENLTKALKGDSQLRGRWGEHKLELILEKSGLIKGRDFVVQGGGLNIRTEEGASQRPDVIVFLPENRHLVIDSKVSLIDYLEYEAADSDETRGECLRNLVSSVRGHVDGLAGKNYQRAETINSLEFVLMFVPMDSVFVLVTQNDQALREYAWQRGIIIVPPSTLFVTMETVASVWRLQRQSENAREIADKAGQLYDKLAAIVGDLNEVHEKIQAAARAHGEAMKKLAKGRGNALLRAQQLKSLGVSSKKEFPPVFIGTERHAVSDDDDDGELPQVSAITPKLLERPEGA
jgi:DNA recombination protein RmuC